MAIGDDLVHADRSSVIENLRDRETERQPCGSLSSIGHSSAFGHSKRPVTNFIFCSAAETASLPRSISMFIQFDPIPVATPKPRKSSYALM